MTDPHHAQDDIGLREATTGHEPPTVKFIRDFRLKRIIDGDTLEVVMDQGWGDDKTERIRLAWVDTPETRGEERNAGIWVEEQVNRWFKERGSVGVLLSNRFKLGSFKRCICSVWVGRDCLNAFLIQNRMGWNTDRNGQLTEPRDLNTLRLPDEVTR